MLYVAGLAQDNALNVWDDHGWPRLLPGDPFFSAPQEGPLLLSAAEQESQAGNVVEYQEGPDGTFYVSGQFNEVNGKAAGMVAKYRADIGWVPLEPDTPFTIDEADVVNRMVIDDGVIYFGLDNPVAGETLWKLENGVYSNFNLAPYGFDGGIRDMLIHPISGDLWVADGSRLYRIGSTLSRYLCNGEFRCLAVNTAGWVYFGGDLTEIQDEDAGIVWQGQGPNIGYYKDDLGAWFGMGGGSGGVGPGAVNAIEFKPGYANPNTAEIWVGTDGVDINMDIVHLVYYTLGDFELAPFTDIANGPKAPVIDLSWDIETDRLAICGEFDTWYGTNPVNFFMIWDGVDSYYNPFQNGNTTGQLTGGRVSWFSYKRTITDRGIDNVIEDNIV